MKRVTLLLVLVVTGACGDRPAPAEEPAAPPPAIEREITSPVPEAIISSSSVYQGYHARGVLRAIEPGWHAQYPAVYPEWVRFDFKAPQTISALSLLPQDEHLERAPRRVRVETSDNGSAWSEVHTIEDACAGEKNRWRTFPLGREVKTSYLRLVVESNCDDPNLLTLRGLRIE